MPLTRAAESDRRGDPEKVYGYDDTVVAVVLNPVWAVGLTRPLIASALASYRIDCDACKYRSETGRAFFKGSLR